MQSTHLKTTVNTRGLKTTTNAKRTKKTTANEALNTKAIEATMEATTPAKINNAVSLQPNIKTLATMEVTETKISNTPMKIIDLAKAMDFTGLKTIVQKSSDPAIITKGMSPEKSIRISGLNETNGLKMFTKISDPAKITKFTGLKKTLKTSDRRKFAETVPFGAAKVNSLKTSIKTLNMKNTVIKKANQSIKKSIETTAPKEIIKIAKIARMKNKDLKMTTIAKILKTTMKNILTKINLIKTLQKKLGKPNLIFPTTSKESGRINAKKPVAEFTTDIPEKAVADLFEIATTTLFNKSITPISQDSSGFRSTKAKAMDSFLTATKKTEVMKFTDYETIFTIISKTLKDKRRIKSDVSESSTLRLRKDQNLLETLTNPPQVDAIITEKENFVASSQRKKSGEAHFTTTTLLESSLGIGKVPPFYVNTLEVLVPNMHRNLTSMGINRLLSTPLAGDRSIANNHLHMFTISSKSDEPLLLFNESTGNFLMNEVLNGISSRKHNFLLRSADFKTEPIELITFYKKFSTILDKKNKYMKAIIDREESKNIHTAIATDLTESHPLINVFLTNKTSKTLKTYDNTLQAASRSSYSIELMSKSVPSIIQPTIHVSPQNTSIQSDFTNIKNLSLVSIFKTKTEKMNTLSSKKSEEFAKRSIIYEFLSPYIQTKESAKFYTEKMILSQNDESKLSEEVKQPSVKGFLDLQHSISMKTTDHPVIQSKIVSKSAKNEKVSEFHGSLVSSTINDSKYLLTISHHFLPPYFWNFSNQRSIQFSNVTQTSVESGRPKQIEISYVVLINEKI